MRGPVAIALAWTMVACEPIPSRGILEPVPPEGPTSATAPKPRPAPAAAPASGTPASPGTATGGFDFEANDRKDEDELLPEDVDEIELQADLLGVDPRDLRAPQPRQPQAYVPSLPMPLWEPNQPLDGGWGLRVISTIHDVQPPRAIIATADGYELVVQPGQMLPEHRMVVLAVGHGVVQVARVTPQGFYAKVETETVASLAPSETPAR